jgi:hypothetical protein
VEARGAPRVQGTSFYPFGCQEGRESSSSRHIYKELQSIMSWVAIVPGSLVFISLLYSCFEISNIYLSLLLVSPMGFFQGHVDQKHLCTFVMVCLLLSAIGVVKILRGYLMF